MTSRWWVACVLLIAACKNATPAPDPASNSAKAEPVTRGGTGSSAPQAAIPDGLHPAGHPEASAAPVPGTIDVAAGSGAKPVIHGDKWQEAEEGGRNFAAFKETWVYVDGVPKGAM